MAFRCALGVVALAAAASAQQMGKNTPEVHPLLPTQECTVSGGCVAKNTSIVLDSNYRWTHTVDGYDNCKPAGLNATLCPDAKTCAANCALEGAEYPTYGIATKDDSLTLNLFVNRSGEVAKSSPRVYLIDETGNYTMLQMLDREIAFDVDMSKLPCGTNGAVYFSEMHADGGKSELNPAGANYGTGYCDAQCPTSEFINGEANVAKDGACCNEMDLWEANRAANAYTPHPCKATGVYRCKGDECSATGVCDKPGCDFNPYRLGDKDFYGKTIDTKKPFTLVTQFITASGDGKGPLKEIRRIYVQDGKEIPNAASKVAGAEGSSITDEWCAATAKAFGSNSTTAFEKLGGLKQMGEALGRGMVLVFSVWNDDTTNMKWLDGTFPVGSDPATQPGTGRGPCSPDEGTVTDLTTNHLDTQVTFSNVKWGEIGSTFKKSAGGGAMGGGSGSSNSTSSEGYKAKAKAR